MAFEHPGQGALDYMPCGYGESKLQFRGPKKSLDAPYVCFFGATETYGRFIEQPFPDLIGLALDKTAVNLGCVNGGIDVFSNEWTLLGVAAGAQATVVQVMGAQNISNRFYSVHPRRNDRFIAPSKQLRSLYGDVDFTDFAFTRHLMTGLQAKCSRRFKMVVTELQAAWVARMRQLLDRIDGPKVLLWLADHSPEQAVLTKAGYSNDPLYVDRAMLNAVQAHADALVEVVYDPSERADSSVGMVFSELEAPAALETPGASVHVAATEALLPVLTRLTA